MTHTPPLGTVHETTQTAGQAAISRQADIGGVGTFTYAPLKTPRKYRFSAATMAHLEMLKTRWNCTETAAVELCIARTAAYEADCVAEDAGVGTPGVGEVQSNER